jgi:hypothetical protein
MTEDEARANLFAVATDLVGIPYWDRGPFTVRHKPSVRPESLSCSEFIVVVFERVFVARDPVPHLGDARTMWRNLAETQTCQTGDLAFFTRRGDPLVDPLTGLNGEPENWHVMMVARPLNEVLGACRTLSGVRQVHVQTYLEQLDNQGRRWHLRGHRRFPL